MSKKEGGGGARRKAQELELESLMSKLWGQESVRERLSSGEKSCKKDRGTGQEQKVRERTD